ncbi:sensor histidine kinase [Paenibacillus psychroresistens]|uniref:histidine kinase n=1 Tax=Paenibacillus psychroresistens TaxID=1778678 RepID=A0A6B8REW7_9BACL|nr:HAMP domain-containing sensor histidine kinase [Paenibacillus psychroresistens]QGQ94699.1 sensor histidine kinase [Paenibacillus psychroresistens]
MFLTIKVKFLLGLFIIFSISLLLLNHFVMQIIDSSNEKIITQDLIGLKKNSNVYVKQTFMINHFTNDEIYFQQTAKEMADELRHVTSSEISAYTVKGESLYATNSSKFTEVIDDDLKEALGGKTAYTISYANGLAEVYYSYPVSIEGKTVGILRFTKDFSLLHEQSKQILNFILYITIAIFAAAFLFSYILSRNITIPIVKLTKASTEVTNGNLDIRIGFKRKDEIGKLANNFSKMIEKIKIQINRIEQDRDRLKELNHHRKQFFDNVTHELKTPLTSILGYAEMIKENGWSDEAFFDKGMNHIIDESKRLHEMVLKVLELSMETSAQEAFDTMDVGLILQDVSEGMAFKAARYSKVIHCNVEGELWVHGLAPKLRQLFINILDNAIKYGASHSAITVEASLAADDVKITISNQGEEINPQDLERIFEPFYRADKQLPHELGSHGLGLGICKAIVDEHGGTIQIHSANFQTNVSIQLPYRRSEVGQV